MHNTHSLKHGLLILLTTILLNSPLAHSVVIGLEPNSFSAGTGDAIALNLVVSDLGNFAPDSLGAFDISVGFDPAIFAFTSYTLGSYLGDLGLLEAIDVGFGDLGGAVNVAEVSFLTAIDLDTYQPGEFTLATLNFNVIDLAAGAVTQLSVLSGSILADANGAPLSVTVSGSASVEGKDSSIPVPGTFYLFSAAFAAWFLTKKRRNFAIE